MKIRMISAADLEKMLQREHALLIDLRTPYEYRQGHIRGAVNLPLSRLRQNGHLDKNADPFLRFSKNRLLIFYCDRGTTSLEVCRSMMEYGYQVASLIGGYMGYIRQMYG